MLNYAAENTGVWTWAQLVIAGSRDTPTQDLLVTELGIPKAMLTRILSALVSYAHQRRATSCKECYGVGHYSGLPTKHKVNAYKELQNQLNPATEHPEFFHEKHQLEAGLANRKRKGFLLKVFGHLQHRHPCICLKKRLIGLGPGAKGDTVSADYRKKVLECTTRGILHTYKPPPDSLTRSSTFTTGACQYRYLHFDALFRAHCWAARFCVGPWWSNWLYQATLPHNAALRPVLEQQTKKVAQQLRIA